MKYLNRKTAYLHPLLLGLLIITGCNKSQEPTAAAPGDKSQAPPSLADLGNKKAVTQAVNSRLQKGDPATPLANYRKIDSGNQVMFLYLGLLNLPVDYEKVVESYSNEYRRTNDSFKKKDILTALQPKIDQEISQAKSARYILLESKDNSLLERYDFNKKSFAVKQFADNDRYTYYNDNNQYTLSNTNATQFATLSVPDEAKARAIEGFLSKYTALRTEIYVYAQDADPSNSRVKLEILKFRVFSPTGELLAEQ
jgi:hypothetical protein